MQKQRLGPSLYDCPRDKSVLECVYLRRVLPMGRTTSIRETEWQRRILMNKVRLGIIGYGGMGTGYVKNIMNGMCPEIEIAAIADRKASRRAVCHEAYPDIPLFEEGSASTGSSPTGTAPRPIMIPAPGGPPGTARAEACC